MLWSYGTEDNQNAADVEVFRNVDDETCWRLSIDAMLSHGYELSCRVVRSLCVAPSAVVLLVRRASDRRPICILRPVYRSQLHQCHIRRLNYSLA